MNTDIAVLRELDELVEAARLLGVTQAKMGFGCHTDEDRRFERVMYESIDKHRAALLDWAAMLAAAPQQPAATSETVNVIGMPEFDGLLDHIYEHGTAAEGVIEKANAFARAVIARYAPQQPAAVNEAKETDLWRCTVCGRVGTVGRCCGEETREPVNHAVLSEENSND